MSENFLVRVESWIARIGRIFSWLVLVIVVLMATNVLLRYTMSVGSVWAQELEWHLLVPLILLVMSWGIQSGESPRIDVLYANYATRKKLQVDLLSEFLTMLVAVTVVWLSLGYVMQSFSILEGSPDPGGIPHRWAIKALIPIGFSILFLQAFATFFKTLRRYQALGKPQ
ncbi:MAG: TRAP transporter small permease subunit [Burkholderiaceae bacterium]|jgi:TRAP-type mannitol/chloroaromatic compound transport system permease small subunit